MKKLISCILCLVLIYSVPTVSASVSAASLSRPTVTVKAGVKKATIKFTKVKNAKKYQIYMKKSGGNWYRIKTITTRKYVKNSLELGKTYYFKVRAVDKKDAKGKFSKVAKVKIKANVSTSSKNVFITDTGTKYHLSTCGSLSRSKHKISIASAKSNGYTACARCKP